MNECFMCSAWSWDYGCSMTSPNRGYTCPLENKTFEEKMEMLYGELDMGGW